VLLLDGSAKAAPAFVLAVLDELAAAIVDPNPWLPGLACWFSDLVAWVLRFKVNKDVLNGNYIKG